MKRTSVLIGAAAILTLVSARAVSIGQIDDFEDGTTQNWTVNLLGQGSVPPEALPVNVPTGGPAGVDDNYLQLTSVGTPGPGGRLVVINFLSQWTGDYIAAGIQSIAMDVKNLGTSDLYLRLLFEDPQGGPPADVAISQNAIFLPAGSDWRSIVFPIKPSDLLAQDGTVENALRNTTALRIFSGFDPFFPPDPVVAQLGVDNISAVPESASTWLLLAGSSSLMGLLRRARAK